MASSNDPPPSSSSSPSGAQPSPIPAASASTDAHQPNVPSGLRHNTIAPSSPEAHHYRLQQQPNGEHVPEFGSDGIHPYVHDFAETEVPEIRVQGEIDEPPASTTAHSRLINNEHKFHIPHRCGDFDCEHGRFGLKPRHGRGAGYGSIPSRDVSPSGQADPVDHEGSIFRGIESTLGNAITGGLFRKSRKKSTTSWLAKRHGVTNEKWLYVLYYIPLTNWIRQYRWSYLEGDLTAAITMASFYIPMALSLADNLAHVPPINGLYSFVFNPLIYAILGTCPVMVVGPEAAGSLLTGSVVKEAINAGTHAEHDDLKHAQVAGMVTGLAGAIILAAGLCRLGFVDGMLSRPFLRGFISAIGVVILVEQLIPEMGLNKIAADSIAAQHGSSLDKILFIFRHGHQAHALTTAVSFSTIAIVMVLRELKRQLQPRMSWVAYVPDRFIVVVLSAVFAWAFDWDHQGLDILGDIRSKGKPFQVHFPFESSNFKHVNDAFSTAFIIALLGFLESCVAAKSLGSGAGKKNRKGEDDGIRDMNLSANRELVALGVANLVGGLFMALPAFGGYGRSKVNASTGGRTPMSSVFLALISLICIVFLLPYFYYIPRGVLSAMISVVAYSLIEEAPHDIRFFWTIGGYIELTLMTLIFFATFLWNLKIGIAVGIGLSLLRLLRHSTRPRIQILGRVPGTTEFENAELYGSLEETSEGVEMVPHCLIVKIPEPLTFANTGSLKDRLRRLEDHGTSGAHPAIPKVTHHEINKNVIFDVHGVTSLDPAAAQVLLEIVEGYVERGTRVFFCRVPSKKTEVWRLMQVSGIVDLCGGEDNFLKSVDEALQATEVLMFDGDENGVGSADEHGRETAPRTFENSFVSGEERRVSLG